MIGFCGGINCCAANEAVASASAKMSRTENSRRELLFISDLLGAMFWHPCDYMPGIVLGMLPDFSFFF